MCHICVAQAEQAGLQLSEREIQALIQDHNHDVSVLAANPGANSNLVSPTGDALKDGLIQGAKWEGSTTLTYSLWNNFFDLYGAETAALGDLITTDWDAAGKARVAAALQTFANVTNLEFIFEETNGAPSFTSDLEFMSTGYFQQFTIGSIGLGVFPSQEFGDMWLDLLGLDRSRFPNVEGSVYLDDYAEIFEHSHEGGRGFWVLLHEIGHALGLKHTHDDGGNARPTFEQLGLSSQDNNLFTIMSYNNVPGASIDYGAAATPMLYDILALQELYGENWNYQNGDNVYSLTDNGIVKTYWDGGGLDRMDASSSNTAANLNLNAGAISQIGNTYAAIAYKVTMEQGAGSRFNDTIVGNDAVNTLWGNGGTDELRGGGGNDSIFGGVGIVDGADAADRIYGDAGDDYLIGNGGDDTIFGGTGGADLNDGNDEIYAGFGADDIYGNSGNDSLFGGGSLVAPNDQNDELFGGLGNDRLYGNGGADTLNGGPGDDYLHGGIDGDTYVMQAGGGRDIIGYFEAGLDTLVVDRNLVSSAQALQQLATQEGNHLTFQFADGTYFLIENISSIAISDIEIV